MCGSIGYSGYRPAAPPLIEGDRRLEYRGYDSSGEMKHGPIELIAPEFPTFELAMNDKLFPKGKSHIQEVLAAVARSSPVAGKGRSP